MWFDASVYVRSDGKIVERLPSNRVAARSNINCISKHVPTLEFVRIWGIYVQYGVAVTAAYTQSLITI